VPVRYLRGSNDRFGPPSRLSVEGESTSGTCSTSRTSETMTSVTVLSVLQVRMAGPGCLTDGCPNVHPTNLDHQLQSVFGVTRRWSQGSSSKLMGGSVCQWELPTLTSKGSNYSFGPQANSLNHWTHIPPGGPPLPHSTAKH
jgi:hypothetical protein